MEYSDFDRKAEILKIIQQFRLIDDTFMAKVFEDKECAQFLLSVILNRNDLTVVKVESQLELKNIQGRSARLDIFAVDDKGKQYDIEVQRDSDGASPKRARYNSCLMDANSVLKGEDVADLPETYVIFITEHDVLKGGKPIYTINRMIAEMDNALFGDESHIIYVNGEIRDETELGKLMQDFFCEDPKKMNSKVLSDRVKQFKESEEGSSKMCKLMEDFSYKCKMQAAEEKSREIAIELWKDGIRNFEKIAKLTHLPLKEVEELFKDGVQ